MNDVKTIAFNEQEYALDTFKSMTQEDLLTLHNLAALEMPYENLEGAWGGRSIAGLRERLKAMLDDARSGGEDYRMPDAEQPLNRLSNWSSWLARYGRFIAGEPPGAAQEADE